MQNILNLLLKLRNGNHSTHYSKSLAVQRHLQILPQIFRIDLPEDLIDAVDACKTNADVKQVELNGPFSNRELKAAGVPVCIIILWENQKILDK
jgi:hypothetical protein